MRHRWVEAERAHRPPVAVNFGFALAGVGILGLGVFHSVMGEIYLVRRLLRRDNLPKLFGGDSFTKLTIRYAWHLLTILCFALAALLFWAAQRPVDETSRVVVVVSGVALAVAGVWGAVSTRGRHVSWIILLGSAASAFAGLR